MPSGRLAARGRRRQPDRSFDKGRAPRPRNHGEALGRREAAERFAHLGKLAFERSERGSVGAGLPGPIDLVGQGADFGFQRLDGAARHGVVQGLSEVGEIATQRAERVLVGLVQRRYLRVDVVELLLHAGHVRRGAPTCRSWRGCHLRCRLASPSRARWRAEICAAQLAGPRLGAGGGGAGVNCGGAGGGGAANRGRC